MGIGEKFCRRGASLTLLDRPALRIGVLDWLNICVRGSKTREIGKDNGKDN